MAEPSHLVDLEASSPADAEASGVVRAPEDAAETQRSLVQWLVLRHSGEWGGADEQAFLNWLNESPQRQQAWERVAPRLDGLRAAPPALARTVLSRSSVPAVSRRLALRQLACLPAIPFVSWLVWSQTPWRSWSADYRTATGVQQRVWLADGSQLLLNTATSLDVRLTDSQRLLQLHAGELQVTTAAALGRSGASSLPPLVVQTPFGTVRALGTRFTVRHEPDGLFWQGHGATQVDVFEGSVAVSVANQSARLGAGQQLRFSADALGPVADTDKVLAGAWTAGLLVAYRMPLVDFVSEIGRYRPGVLRVAPQVGHLQISGVFPVLEPDRCLYLLTQTLPVRLQTVTDLWTTVVPA